MTRKKNLPQLHKSKSKKQPFFVRYIGENGELLNNSENLTTKENCFVNMSASRGIWVENREGDVIEYVDYTLAKPTKKRFYVKIP